MIEYLGKKQSLGEWAAEYGLDVRTLHSRLKRGWTIERALTEKATRDGARTLTFKGRTQTLAEWSSEVGLKTTTLRKRLDAGWAPGQALYKPAGKPRG